jgi:hypothetical protein
MTKEKAWDNFVTQLNNFGWYSDRSFLKIAWEVSWSDAYKAGFEEGCVKGNQAAVESRVAKMIDAQKTFEPSYPYVHYGYRFIAYPDGTLTITPTGANKK